MGIDKTFKPSMNSEKVKKLLTGWNKAVKCVEEFAK